MTLHFIPPRSGRTVVNSLATLALLSTFGMAQAAVFKDAHLESLQDAGKYVELEQAAQARLKTNATDTEAAAALALALTFMDTSDVKRLEAGARQAKRCVEQYPTAAVCYLATAQNLSMQMLGVGMVKAMRMVGSLKDAWIRTLELDPANAVARVQLAKVYVTVPGWMGGSVSKARDLETAVRSSQPEVARIIRVHIAAEEKKWGEMENELLAMKPGQDSALLEEVCEATMQLASNLLKDDKDLPKAKSLYEGLQRDQPLQAAGAYGLGRVHAVMGKTDDAIRFLERAKTLSGADSYPIDHRLGDAYLAKGDKAQAKVAYERYIANKRANPANVESARKSLANLG